MRSAVLSSCHAIAWRSTESRSVPSRSMAAFGNSQSSVAEASKARVPVSIRSVLRHMLVEIRPAIVPPRRLLGVAYRPPGGHWPANAIESLGLVETGIRHAPKPAADDEVAPVRRHLVLQDTQNNSGLFKRTRPLSHRRIFEIHNPVWGRAADEFSDKGAPDIVLLNRTKRSRNQTPQPSYVPRRVSIACDNSRTKNREALEAYSLNRLFF
jgi:hypothetical protein